MRYDTETGLGFYINADRTEFQPRIGLAYSPDAKTVIRAGYGIFYDRYNLTFFFVPGPLRPPVIPGLPTNNDQMTGTWLLNSLFLPTPCFGGILNSAASSRSSRRGRSPSLWDSMRITTAIP
jgi:hypothetical protein